MRSVAHLRCSLLLYGPDLLHVRRRHRIEMNGTTPPNTTMSRGPDLEEDLYVNEDDLAFGSDVHWFDIWNFPCNECRGSGVFRNRPCRPCGASGHVQQELRKSVVIKVPAGTRIGQRIRLKGLGFPGSDPGLTHCGDLILTLRAYGDGTVRPELASGQRLSPRLAPCRETRSLAGHLGRPRGT
jgi:hypothetical protein